MRETLETVAAFLQPILGTGGEVVLTVNDRALYLALLATGESTMKTHVYCPRPEDDGHYAIEHADAVIDGVRFSAQWRRPATLDEVAELDEARLRRAVCETHPEIDVESPTMPGAA